MKITTENLKSALAPIVPLVGGRITLPILSSLRLSAANNTLEVHGTNLDCYAVSRVECTGDLEACCIPGVALSRLTESANGFLEFNATKGRIEIKSGWDSKLPTLPAEEFPKQPELKSKQLGVNVKDLSEAISRVAWAACREPDRYIIKSVAVNLDGKSIQCRASDGKHFAQYDKASICAQAAFILPDTYAMTVAKTLFEPEAQISYDEKHACVTHANGSVAVKLLEGVYPSTKQETDEPSKDLGRVVVSELLAHLETASAICVGDFVYGWLVFGQSGLKFQLTDGKGNTDYKAVILGKFEAGSIRIDVRRLIAVLRHVQSDEINFGFTETKHMHFQDGDTLMLLQALSPGVGDEAPV